MYSIRQVAKSSLDTKLKGTGLAVAAINNTVIIEGQEYLHVTLCGSDADVEKWLATDEGAARMRPKHPWHHPSYHHHIDRALLDHLSSGATGPRACRFFSATAGAEVNKLGTEHWIAWLTEPVNFCWMVDSMISSSAVECPPLVVEIGAHPVLSAMLYRLNPSIAVSSMCRDQDSAQWMLEQRSKLVEVKPEPFMEALNTVDVKLDSGIRRLSRDVPFGAQGFASVQYAHIAEALSRFFPGLKSFDLYRYSNVEQLIKGFGRSADQGATVASSKKEEVANAMVLGVGLCLPPAVATCDQLWDALLGDDCAVRKVEGKKYFGGYLEPEAFDVRREGQKRGVEPSELNVIDPQHVLALELVARCFEDAGEETVKAALSTPDRFGVYLGAWQAPSPPEQRNASAYRTLAMSLSAIAARVANTYNIQGPAITVNTACSSGLVALNSAMKDLRAGVIDYAMVGGVNLFTDEALFADLARANFLSPTGRCHTFSSKADGYARAEGGVVMLLARDDGMHACRAVIRGAATNQNSQRRPMTAVDPLAQERVIRSACLDAGIQPSQLAVVECHGTGTKLGDPVEMSALAATVGSNRKDGSVCQLTAAKMRFGHLESAAGSLGLLKAVLMAEKHTVPGDEVPSVNPAVTEAVKGFALKLPSAEGCKLKDGDLIGISSFGFAGNNAHAIVEVVSDKRRAGLAEPEAKKKQAPPPTAVPQQQKAC